MTQPRRSRLFVALSGLVMLTTFAAQAHAAVVPGYVRLNDDVYWLGQDGERHLFPAQDEALKSWSIDPATVPAVSAAELAAHPLGSSVRFKPGTKPALVATGNQVYAVARHGVLRPIASPAVLAQLYPTVPASAIPKIAVAQFTNYVVESPIRNAADFDPAAEAVGILTPDDNPPVVASSTPSVTVQKTFQGTLTLTITKLADGTPVANAIVSGANSPAQSLTVELVNQSNIPIQICTASAACSQALAGAYAANVTAVTAKAFNELGEMLLSQPVPVSPIVQG